MIELFLVILTEKPPNQWDSLLCGHWPIRCHLRLANEYNFVNFVVLYFATKLTANRINPIQLDFRFPLDNWALTSFQWPLAIAAAWIQTELRFVSATRESTINSFSKWDAVEIIMWPRCPTPEAVNLSYVDLSPLLRSTALWLPFVGNGYAPDQYLAYRGIPRLLALTLHQIWCTLSIQLWKQGMKPATRSRN